MDYVYIEIVHSKAILSIFPETVSLDILLIWGNFDFTSIICPSHYVIITEQQIDIDRLIYSSNMSMFGKWKHQLDATILSILFHLILLSTCFGCYTHPSSGASNMYNQVWYNLITVIAMGVQTHNTLLADDSASTGLYR